MAAPKNKGPAEVFTKQSTGAGCLVRLSWMLLGNFALLVSAKFISSHQGSFLSTADLVFWVVVGATIAMRYLDIRKMDGMTATGEPASMKHWKIYSLIFTGVALVIWVTAHLWGAYR